MTPIARARKAAPHAFPAWLRIMSKVTFNYESLEDAKVAKAARESAKQIRTLKPAGSRCESPNGVSPVENERRRKEAI